eukprot:2318164-Alexandrium_andersonii.AAC.1
MTPTQMAKHSMRCTPPICEAASQAFSLACACLRALPVLLYHAGDVEITALRQLMLRQHKALS